MDTNANFFCEKSSCHPHSSPLFFLRQFLRQKLLTRQIKKLEVLNPFYRPRTPPLPQYRRNQKLLASERTQHFYRKRLRQNRSLSQGDVLEKRSYLVATAIFAMPVMRSRSHAPMISVGCWRIALFTSISLSLSTPVSLPAP